MVEVVVRFVASDSNTTKRPLPSMAALALVSTPTTPLADLETSSVAWLIVKLQTKSLARGVLLAESSTDEVIVAVYSVPDLRSVFGVRVAVLVIASYTMTAG